MSLRTKRSGVWQSPHRRETASQKDARSDMLNIRITYIQPIPLFNNMADSYQQGFLEVLATGHGSYRSDLFHCKGREDRQDRFKSSRSLCASRFISSEFQSNLMTLVGRANIEIED